MLELNALNKTYHIKGQDIEAVKDVSLTIQDGEIFGIIGYSGAGKSSLVRCINLLEQPDSGTIRMDGQILFSEVPDGENGPGEHIRLKSRELNRARQNIGMIFQHFNLFDRRTVFGNVAYPLELTGMKKAAIRERVNELLEMVNLADKADAYPSQLSGGQKQRVAIARALANKPQVLLSDEATSALDPDATESILSLLKELNEKLGLTIVIITHEMAVIKAICHKVAVIENGAVAEQGEVYEVFAHSKQPITRRFIASASPLEKVHSLMAADSPLVRVGDRDLLVRLTFERDCVGDALISQVSRLYQVNVNIVLANVEIIQGEPLGGMIAILTGEEEQLKAAVRCFAENNVRTEVLSGGSDH